MAEGKAPDTVSKAAELPPPARIRPRDAATLILIDRSSAQPRVLMGLRSNRHVFMPDLFVFPGGRRDRGDGMAPTSDELQMKVLAQLARPGDAVTAHRARGLAVAAVRELHEETGLAIGTLKERLWPALSGLRYVARAITPPGGLRRFDTRFFCTFTDEVDVDPAAIRDSDELSCLQWLDIQGLCDLKMPPITRTILDDLKKSMQTDPSLPFGSAGPFYYPRRGRMLRGNI